MDFILASLSPCMPEPRTPDVFRFGDLVFDVQAYIIASFVPRQDLRSLALVSRHISPLATQALFFDVTLLKGSNPPPGDARAPTEILVSAQHAFTKQVLADRRRAYRVRTLAWQVCGSCSAFTNVFPLLDSVTNIHLDNAHPTRLRELNPVIPALFPRVTDVKLSGMSSLPFIMPILHSPQRLSSLSLDAVSPHSVAVQVLQWVSAAELSNLRSLSLRTLCKSWRTQPWNESRELLSAWRDALSAVRQTVEEVTLSFTEQAAVPRDASLPSAGRFAQVVMPVFLEEKWPRLKAVRFESIDITDANMAQALVRLREVLPGVVVHSTIDNMRYTESDKI